MAAITDKAGRDLTRYRVVNLDLTRYREVQRSKHACAQAGSLWGNPFRVGQDGDLATVLRRTLLGFALSPWPGLYIIPHLVRLDARRLLGVEPEKGQREHSE
jgi:hypothetical protein